MTTIYGCESCSELSKKLASVTKERDRLREDVEWRSVYPTCEGYWWHRGPNGVSIQRVRMGPIFGVASLGPYDSDTNDSLLNVDGEWAGPIPVPFEPRRATGG